MENAAAKHVHFIISAGEEKARKFAQTISVDQDHNKHP